MMDCEHGVPFDYECEACIVASAPYKRLEERIKAARDALGRYGGFYGAGDAAVEDALAILEGDPDDAPTQERDFTKGGG